MNNTGNIRKVATVSILISMLFLSACSSTKKCANGEMGILKKLDLDGCGWVIELKNGERLQPINLHDFEVPMKEGLSMSISYNRVHEMASICMAGIIVELSCLQIQE